MLGLQGNHESLAWRSRLASRCTSPTTESAWWWASWVTHHTHHLIAFPTRLNHHQPSFFKSFYYRFYRKETRKNRIPLIPTSFPTYSILHYSYGIPYWPETIQYIIAGNRRTCSTTQSFSVEPTTIRKLYSPETFAAIERIVGRNRKRPSPIRRQIGGKIRKYTSRT